MPASARRFSDFRDAVRRARVLVVGDVMLDRYWFGDVERISPEAPVPVVKIARSEERPGGAANVARNAAALGAQVTLLSVVGDDEPGACARAAAWRREACTRRCIAIRALPTTVKLRVIGRQQQLLRIDFETRAVATRRWPRSSPTTSARWPVSTSSCFPITARAGSRRSRA